MADLVTLDDVRATEVAPQEADDSVVDETAALQAEKGWVELEEIRTQIEHRKRYASHIFRGVSAWMVLVFGVLLADGWGWCGLDISDKVMMTLLGGTTINVLGIFAIVANYFFPKP